MNLQELKQKVLDLELAIEQVSNHKKLDGLIKSKFTIMYKKQDKERCKLKVSFNNLQKELKQHLIY